MAVDPTKVFALSKVFHERARLGIMTVLVSREGEVEFGEVLGLLGLTKGNLAVHVSKLEEAGYLEVHKGFAGKMPRTTYSATVLGRKDFTDYLALLEEVIAQARGEP
ncbi:MAG: transcriptional regulator [Polyangia bacterium]|jgi:DNA-binding MarR family transcriptional regulator|nr:transcriptional regulator [Polyangia bacterium]